MSRVLLTGATGFVGRNLLQGLIDRGDDVAIIVRNNSKLLPLHDGVKKFVYNEDFESVNEAIKEFKPDVVCHVASLYIHNHVSSDVKNLISSNILFPSYLVEACVKNGVKDFLNIGTAWQYKTDNSKDFPNLYVSTKHAFDNILSHYTGHYPLSSASVLLYDTFGSGDTRNKLISKLLEIAKTGENLDMSPGEQKICLIYIKDVVSGLIAAIDHLSKQNNPINQTYVLYTGQLISLRELANKIREITGRNLNINWGAKPYRQGEIMIPWTTGDVPPGWGARYTIEEGLKEIWNE